MQSAALEKQAASLSAEVVWKRKSGVGPDEVFGDCDGLLTRSKFGRLRVLAGLPLGDTGLINSGAFAMVNLLGDVWDDFESNLPLLLAEPRLRLHLYGKEKARPGRKMGHIMCFADSASEAIQITSNLRSRLQANAVQPAVLNISGQPRFAGQK